MDDAEGRFMVNGIGGHRADQRDLVCDATGAREQFRQLHSAVAVADEFIRRTEQLAGSLGRMDLESGAAVFTAVPLCELRLGVEQVHVTWTTVLEEADDGF